MEISSWIIDGNFFLTHPAHSLAYFLHLSHTDPLVYLLTLRWIQGGQAFPVETLQMPYDRLPADAQNVVTEGVWTQAVESASIHVDFMSNTDQIYVNFTLYNSNTDFDNMDALGHSSVDLYAWDTNTTMFRWISTYQSPQYPNNYGLLAQGRSFTYISWVVTYSLLLLLQD